MRYDSLLDLIGNTPLVRLRYSPSNVEIFAKLEKNNPGGSVKDRIAKAMIEEAESSGRLRKGMTVVEPTSGNTGIGLALVCLLKGYRLVLVMPDTMSVERRQILMSLGAKILLTEGAMGMNGAEDFAKSLVASSPDEYFMPDQFSNSANPRVHYETTGEEIWRDTGGRVTHFVAGMGTTGTIVGVARSLKAHNPDVKVIGVQPDPSSPIMGLKNLEVSYVPKVWTPSLVDEIRFVTEPETEDAARTLILREGIFVGLSSGAAYKAAIDLAQTLREGIIVFIAPDGGERYLSTPLCDPAKCLECVNKYGLRCSYSDGRPIMRASEIPTRAPGREGGL